MKQTAEEYYSMLTKSLEESGQGFLIQFLQKPKKIDQCTQEEIDRMLNEDNEAMRENKVALSQAEVDELLSLGKK